MMIKEIEYGGFKIEVHEHPIYHDFEYVVKSLDGHEVKGTSSHPYEHPTDAESAAMEQINNMI